MGSRPRLLNPGFGIRRGERLGPRHDGLALRWLGQYYDYALANALLFQLHDHIAYEILEQDPHDTNYWGSREVGDFLRALMEPGASRPWREVLRETTGRELDAQAMVEYFEPLYDWLVEENAGRAVTFQ